MERGVGVSLYRYGLCVRLRLALLLQGSPPVRSWADFFYYVNLRDFT